MCQAWQVWQGQGIDDNKWHFETVIFRNFPSTYEIFDAFFHGINE
jgi:hypothetical protein